MRLIDTHAHLPDIEDLRPVLERAKDEGVTGIISVSSNLKTSKDNLVLSTECTELKIFVAIGIHPCDLNPSELDDVKRLIEENIQKIVAIGEIGLDFWRKEAKKEETKEQQRKVFKEQLDLALNYDIPVIIHSRGAWRDCLEIVLEKRLKKALFHWYSGPLDTLKEIIKNGYLISATPACEYSKEHREVIRNTPIENLLLETDSPVVYKDYESEPKDILRVLKEVATLKGVSQEELLRLTTENAIRFFNL